MKSSNSSARLEQIRRKYDTPTRAENKENYARSSLIHKDAAAEKAFSRQNKYDRDISNDMKASLSKRILQDQSVKAKMTSSIMGPKNQLYDSTNFESISQRRSCLGSFNQQSNKESRKYEEQAVFKRIKEMKESLMGKSNYQNIKPTHSIIQQKKEEARKKTEVPTHRIDNIDQINSKIQQILSCLKENQSRTKAYQNLLDGQKQVSVQETDFSSKTNFTNNMDQLRNKYVESGSKKTQFQIRQSASIYQEEKNRAIHSPLQKKINGFKIDTENKKDTSRARSFINSVRKQTGQTVGPYQLNSGKKLDDQITKIQDKIKYFQQEKKKLNIQYTPFTYSHSKSSSTLTRKGFSVHKDFKIDDEKKTRDYRYSYSKMKNQVDQRLANKTSTQNTNQIRRSILQKKSNEDRFGLSNYSSNRSAQNFYPNRKDIKEDSRQNFEIKLFPVTTGIKSQISEKYSETIQTEKQENSINYEEIRKKTQEGIDGRKARLGNNYSHSKNNTETMRLIESLGQQAKMDQQFRNNKICFEAKLNKNKWEQLLQIANKEFNLNLSIDEVKIIFNLSDQQNNPFFSVRNQDEGNMKNFVKSYIDCQKHWKEVLKGKFSKEKLKEQDFNMQKLDLERKGYLLHEDLVRFLNISTGTFYRNRDLYLIFKRMSVKQKIQFEELIAVFCNKN